MDGKDWDRELVVFSHNGDIDGAKEALLSGADIHYDNNFALMAACTKGHLQVVKYLIDQGANIHARDDYALRNASHDGHFGIVKYLVEKGADIHANEDWALRGASGNGHLEIVKYLVEQGADIHAEGEWALVAASMSGHFQICDYLVSQGCDPQNVIDSDISEANKQWAIDFVKARDLSNKLTNELGEKSSKAERLVSSIDEDADAPVKKPKYTRQKI
ncbi:ankyrin repeat domain-containing protein [Burkholderia contaminans]|uniref:ankyrin repeat domain-containing protein n=1 Tax=Burkholderia contaminans TaxID=488447 RepID=UPI00158D08C4|nr:ankyrin repeat domain-containing protein [Burkholderia contaminans]